jgi:hypothetical protein
MYGKIAMAKSRTKLDMAPRELKAHDDRGVGAVFKLTPNYRSL